MDEETKPYLQGMDNPLEPRMTALEERIAAMEERLIARLDSIVEILRAGGGKIHQ